MWYTRPMRDPSKLPPEDCGFGYYAFVLILALLMLVGMLVLATKPLWQ